MSNEKRPDPVKLRSAQWFDDPEDPRMTATYVERYLNFGLTLDELQSGRPIIGIAQTGSDLAPCNRHHIELAKRVADGIREQGGTPLEFPVHPIQETGKRPTAALDRNLAYLSLVEVLFGYPLDGVVLTTGCDKTTPACLMAAATVNLPAIVLSGGPMLNGHYRGKSAGSGSIIWQAREQMARGELDYAGFMNLAAASAPSVGHCNTMGTALTMNCIAEALGMSLPGCAAIPAPYRERQQMAYATGRQIVDMVRRQIRPRDVLTPPAFRNAIRVTSAIGGSTNAPVHVIAIARAAGVSLTLQDWQDFGCDVPMIVNCQPTGEYLGEDFFRAGGLPAVIRELVSAGEFEPEARTIEGLTWEESLARPHNDFVDRSVIREFDDPVMQSAGLRVMRGNFFDNALFKASAVTKEFLSEHADDNGNVIFECVATVFEGPEDYHDRINDPSLGIDRNSVLVMRGAGPVGYPGSAEVVNMLPPDSLVRQGVSFLPCLGDGRQSGTSASPSFLHVVPEAAAGGGIGLIETGDRIRVDLEEGRVDLLVDEDVLERRRREVGTFAPKNQTPWQEIYREKVGQLDTGAMLELGDSYVDVLATHGNPRHSH